MHTFALAKMPGPRAEGAQRKAGALAGNYCRRVSDRAGGSERCVLPILPPEGGV